MTFRLRPRNSPYANVRAVPDKSLSSEQIEIQLQSACRQTRWRGRAIRGSRLGLEIVVRS